MKSSDIGIDHKIVVTNETMTRYYAGDYISNDEIVGLIDIYSRVQNDCIVLGPRFYLAMSEAARNVISLGNIAHNRSRYK